MGAGYGADGYGADVFRSVIGRSQQDGRQFDSLRVQIGIGRSSNRKALLDVCMVALPSIIFCSHAVAGFVRSPDCSGSRTSSAFYRACCYSHPKSLW